MRVLEKQRRPTSSGAAVQSKITSDQKGLNGAESMVRSLLGAGVDTYFANPGQSRLRDPER